MFCIWTKEKMINLATTGSRKLLSALRKFLRDSQLINEIYDRADKDLFLAVANSKEYCYVEDIRENDIFDKFVELCFDQQSLGLDVEGFVNEHYPHKSKKAKRYVIWFYHQLSAIIFDVLKRNSSPDTKIILRDQEIAVEKILDKLSVLEKQIIATSAKKSPTTVVTYCANMQMTRWHIDNYESAIDDKEIVCTISLTLSNSTFTQQDGQIFWNNEKSSLIYNFERKVAPLLEEGGSFSVFGFAPAPLLILFGNQFANRPNIDIYQLKKTPSTWKWEKSASKLNIKTIWHQELTNVTEAVMILSFSGRVSLENINKNLNTKELPIVELTIETPYEDFLRTKEQLDEFVKEFRKTKSILTSAGIKQIHLFAAIPVAFAITIGQAYNPNYDAKLVTYDYNQGIYTKVLTIGENT